MHAMLCYAMLVLDALSLVSLLSVSFMLVLCCFHACLFVVLFVFA